MSPEVGRATTPGYPPHPRYTDPWAHLLIGFHPIPIWQPFLRGHLAVWGRRTWRLNDFASASKSF